MKFKCSLVRILIFTVFAQVFSFLQAVSPAMLKGTYDPLKVEYRLCSPLFGAFWWESDLVKKLYLFGDKDEHTVQLINQLFHEVAGSFGIVKSDQFFSCYLTPKAIGQIIGALENTRESGKKQISDDDLNKEIDKKINVLKRAKDALAKIERKNKKQLEQLRNIEKELDTLWMDEGRQAFKKILTNDSAKKILKSLSDDVSKVCNDLVSKAPEAARNGVTPFVKSLLGSLSECGFFTNTGKELFFPYATYSVLLTFLYRRAEKREDLWAYFEGLNEQIKNGVFETALNAKEWLKQANYTLKEADKIFALLEKKDEQEIEKIVGQFLEKKEKEVTFEQLAYAELVEQYYYGVYPKIAGDTKVKFFMDWFTNCVETTMRNICDIILYDREVLNFDTVLSKKFTRASEAFKRFYKENSDPSNLEAQTTHQAWVQEWDEKAGSIIDEDSLVENKPYIAYNRVLPAGKDIPAKDEARHHCDGYIFGDGLITNDKGMVELPGGQKYQLIDPKEYKLYELMPTVRNIIILLNEFLGFNLFAGKKFSELFVTKDFNEVYFPKLCKKLGWEIQSSNVKNLDLAESKKEIAKDISLVITPKGLNVSFTITLLPNQHGALSMPTVLSDKNKTMREIMLNVAQRSLMDEKNPAHHGIYAQWLILFGMREAFTFDSETGKNPILSYYRFLFQDMIDHNKKIDLIGSVFNAIAKGYLSNKDTLYKRVCVVVDHMINALVKHGDLFYLEEVIKKIPNKFNLNEHKLLEKSIEKIITFAKKGMQGDENTKLQSINLIKALVDKDQYFEEAVEAAKIGMQSSVASKRSDSINLFRALFKKSQGFKEAIAFVKTGMQRDKDFWRQTITLSKALVDNDQGFKEAGDVAKTGMQTFYVPVRSDSINLFSDLFKKNQGFIEAKKAIEEGEKSEDEGVKEGALKLKELLEKHKKN